MKLATFVPPGGSARPGAIIDTAGGRRVLDLVAAATRTGRADAVGASLLQLIEAGEAALESTRRVVEACAADEDISSPLDRIRLLAPIPEPPQMRDFSVFPGHIREAPAGMARIAQRKGVASDAPTRPLQDVPQVYRDRPIYYITNRFSVSGPDATVSWPAYSELMDFELEFGIFLSKGGCDIPLAKAREHIFGYTIYNDFSARDTQFEEMRGMLGPAKGKSFDAGNVIGPWIVTADEIPDAYNLSMRARVNGEIWTDSTSRGMLHSFEDMIAYVSRNETLRAGEFMGSGTVGGGCGLELDRWLNHGDTVELEVERIGKLRNQVVRRVP
ncbi:fumarylacetoacetate hydrolase family protein [Bradyrhizobium sp. CCGUVB1N3]|uniref:fumarylacetoacetate hydrolase family protein n=1 Tax=Bradyrhizobium sp. CCGUVB1N3 TaxID=2949629 RepID=UPI0020B2F437|nr:fumarylacetoacetate hydrolase family protein [Bradyrhizobium sp. CCGUVB1N3]MCP3474971.1 fumarylacetoacetate hydrolase family protein [Bradyrhizobium sp. CCGUVB1N3]